MSNCLTEIDLVLPRPETEYKKKESLVINCIFK